MNTAKIREITELVDKLRARLHEQKTNLEKIRAHNGQSGYAVSINGVRVDVSMMDSRTYMGTLIRGRDMIHLGAIKAVSAMVDDYQDAVNQAEQQLKDYIKR